MLMSLEKGVINLWYKVGGRGLIMYVYKNVFEIIFMFKYLKFWW